MFQAGRDARRTEWMTPTCPAKTLAIPAPRESVWLSAIYPVERVAAIIALLLLAPAGLVIAITICLLSRRGPLVAHRRVGWRGSPLPVLKFRTMWENGAPRARWEAIEDVSGKMPPAKGPGDARVQSRFAAFCRRYSLDEIPQLYHVVKGEMSLVGPRPITRAELDYYYGDLTDEILSLRPGLTGLWQIRGRNQLSWERRRRLDLLLVRRASAGLYFHILVRSIPAVLSGRGAY
jgi:exopolysaccharide production protein ExoY